MGGIQVIFDPFLFYLENAKTKPHSIYALPHETVTLAPLPACPTVLSEPVVDLSFVYSGDGRLDEEAKH